MDLIKVLAVLFFVLSVTSAKISGGKDERRLGAWDYNYHQGQELTPNEKLYRNQFIAPNWQCPDNDPEYCLKFGLDGSGVLGVWNWNNEVFWNSGIQGSYLSLQESDGNLVLYDNGNKPKWATHCFANNPKIKFVRIDGHTVLEGRDGSNRVLWTINEDGQETTCHPSSYSELHPMVQCVGDNIYSDERLYANQYICDGDVRFGLNARGSLSLWHRNSAIWSPPHHSVDSWSAEDTGEFLELQEDDGNLVHYTSQGDAEDALWSTGCFADGLLSLQVGNGGVKLARASDAQSVVWRIDSGGSESGCNDVPAECDRVGLWDKVSCRIRMIDHGNLKYVELEAKDIGYGVFEVADNVNGGCGGDPKVVDVRLDKQDIVIDAGVPEVTCLGMIELYKVPVDWQVDFLPVEGHPCTTFGENLIWFMVLEWFYFG